MLLFKEVLCNDPGGISFGKKNKNQELYRRDATVSYRCDKGYVMREATSIIRCTENGTWNRHPPSCICELYVKCRLVCRYYTSTAFPAYFLCLLACMLPCLYHASLLLSLLPCILQCLLACALACMLPCILQCLLVSSPLPLPPYLLSTRLSNQTY